MCCSMEPAHFSDTTLYAGEAERDGELVHVMGYQNKAQHLGTDPRHRMVRGSPAFDWGTIRGMVAATLPRGNAMILPIPSSSRMSSANVLDTKGCPRILADIGEAIPRPRTRGGTLMGGGMSYAKSFSVQVFDTGIYRVVLVAPGATVDQVRRALDEQVPDEKRPPVKDTIIESYLKDWYPGWHLALCCFSNQDAIKADPLLWWYTPLYPNALFAPALDAHDGNAPDLQAQVEVDHQVAFGSCRMVEGVGEEVEYGDRNIPSSVRSLLPERIIGEVKSGRLPNGDFVALVDDVRAGRTVIERLPPPGAAQPPTATSDTLI